MTAFHQIPQDILVREGRARAGDIELHYEDWGNPADPAILLIMGLSAQMLLWPAGFCELLVKKGFRVIRFDNRDIGLSTKIKVRSKPMNDLVRMARFSLGIKSPSPYSLYDMAADCVGLLDHLGIRQAHVVGASMGGMIAQILAGKHSDRVLSLGVIFSSNNQPLLPPPAPSAIAPLMKGPGKDATREQLIAHSKKLMRTIGSPEFPNPDEELEAFASMLLERSHHPAGVKRQFMAVLSSGSLRPLAKSIKAPTAVIHGLDDILVRPACGRAIARSIKGSKLHLIPGMGHDLPRVLWPMFADMLADNFRRATA